MMYRFLFHYEEYDLELYFYGVDYEDARGLADRWAKETECFDYEYIGEDDEDVHDC